MTKNRKASCIIRSWVVLLGGGFRPLKQHVETNFWCLPLYPLLVLKSAEQSFCKTKKPACNQIKYKQHPAVTTCNRSVANQLVETEKCLDKLMEVVGERGLTAEGERVLGEARAELSLWWRWRRRKVVVESRWTKGFVDGDAIWRWSGDGG